MGAGQHYFKQHKHTIGLNKMIFRKRFLDDICFFWDGSKEQFKTFKEKANEIGYPIGLTFTGYVDEKVDFLDVTTELIDGNIKTSLSIINRC